MRARRGAIDFVGQNDVGEQRAGAELKFASIGLIDADAEHVAGKKIGSELHALKSAVERFCEGLRQRGFAYAGDVFDEQVAAREKSD